MTEERRKWK